MLKCCKNCDVAKKLCELLVANSTTCSERLSVLLPSSKLLKFQKFSVLGIVVWLQLVSGMRAIQIHRTGRIVVLALLLIDLLMLRMLMVGI